jgi:hypothetical protein
MRKTPFALILSLLALIAVPALAVPALAAGPGVVPSADEPAATAPISADLSLDEVLADPVETAIDTSGWGCPNFAPTCTSNSQCDAYCGGAGFGFCADIIATGCCECLG